MIFDYTQTTEKQILDHVRKVKENNSSTSLSFLVNQFKPFMSKLCLKKCLSSYEDGMQVCTMGLLLACRKFNFDCGIKFITFAFQEIQGYLNTHVRDTRYVKMSNSVAKNLMEENSDLYNNLVKPDSYDNIVDTSGIDFKDPCDAEEEALDNCIKKQLYDVIISHPRGELFLDYYGLYERQKLPIRSIAKKYSVSPASVYTIIERIRNVIATHTELATAV